MLTTMTARVARDGFTDLLGAVYYLKKTAKMRFFGMVDDIQKRNKDKNIAATIREVATTVERVRQDGRGENG